MPFGVSSWKKRESYHFTNGELAEMWSFSVLSDLGQLEAFLLITQWLRESDESKGCDRMSCKCRNSFKLSFTAVAQARHNRPTVSTGLNCFWWLFWAGGLVGHWGLRFQGWTMTVSMKPFFLMPIEKKAAATLWLTGSASEP